MKGINQSWEGATQSAIKPETKFKDFAAVLPALIWSYNYQKSASKLVASASDWVKKSKYTLKD